MSKKQQPTPTIVNNYTQDRAAAQTPSAAEQAISDRNKKITDWAESGDYRQPPKGVFFNFTDPAIRQEQRKLLDNSSQGGIFDLGSEGGNSNLLALNKQNLNDHFERDSSADYQQQVANTVAGAYASDGQLMSTDLQRKMGIYSTDAGIYNSELSRVAQANAQPKWWQTLLGGAGAVGAAFAGSPSGSAQIAKWL